MTTGEQDEYTALRATIRERGTARVALFVFGGSVWAALAVATAALAAPPVAALLPLAVLVLTFEAVFALHVGVERVGRYLHVFHGDTWEHAAAAFGRPRGAARIDALFTAPFLVAALLNLEPLLAASPTVQELVFVLGAHALFAVRVLSGRAVAARQRSIDTARFEQLKQERV